MIYRRAINPLNAFPFYDSIEQQQFRDRKVAGEPVTGIFATTTQIPNFQIPITFPSSTFSVSLFDVEDISFSNPIAISNNLIDIDCFANDYTLATYNGGDIQQNLTCGGFYFIRFTSSTGAVVNYYYSEVFQVIASPDVTLSFWNEKDYHGIYYQDGFKQNLFLKGQFDRPIIELDEQTDEDGEGTEIVIYSREVEKASFVFIDVMESMYNGLNSVRGHSNREILINENSLIYQLEEYQFEKEDLGNYYAKGIITYRVRLTINNQCGEDLVKVNCPANN